MKGLPNSFIQTNTLSGREETLETNQSIAWSNKYNQLNTIFFQMCESYTIDIVSIINKFSLLKVTKLN